MTARTDRHLSAQEIADAQLPGVPATKRGVTALAKRLGWDEQARLRAGRGGGLEYPVSIFPAAAQRALLADDAPSPGRLAAVEAVHAFLLAGRGRSWAVAEVARGHDVSEASLWRWLASVEGLNAEARAAALTETAETRRAAFEAEAGDASATAIREAGLAAFTALPETARAVAEARAAVLKAVAGLAGSTGLPMTKARDIFAAAWEAGEDDFGLDAEMRGIVTRLSASSLKRWQGQFDRGGLAALAPKHGAARKGTGTIDRDDAIRVLVEGMMLQHPDVSARLVMRAIRARHDGPDLPSYRTVQRWMATWRQENRALLQMASSPDGYRSRVRLVSGKADEGIVRLNQRWEMDSTPNDVILADGKRHALIGCIDVYSRRVTLLVARTSNAAAVAACLRKAILAWGVPEEIKTDNGSDYASKHIATVVRGFEIAQSFCTPFNPQEKPHIERVFRTFSGGVVELLDGFIGHNVDQRKKIEDRKAFAARLMDRSGEPLELRMTAEELQDFCDRWSTDLYEREDHSTLGQSPFARAQGWTGPVRRIRDERALDILLMAVAGDDGTRVVTKYGISVENAKYVAPELQRLVGQRVQVRLDEENWGQVLVLSKNGEFIAWAICPERNGVSRSEVAGWLRERGREVEKGFRAEIAKAKREVRLSAVAEDILGKGGRDRGSVLPFPSGSNVDHTTPALDAGKIAARAKGKPRLVEVRDDVTIEDVARLDDARPVVREETREARHTRWMRIDARVTAGEAVDDAGARFWRSYQTTPDHAAMIALIEEFGPEMVLGEAAADVAG